MKAPELRMVWMFGPGADAAAHTRMAACGAQVLIQDLEDFTPPELRGQARAMAPALFSQWRDAGAMICVRINSLETQGLSDLAAVMPHGPDIIAYPKAAGAGDMRHLDAALAFEEKRAGRVVGSTEILPVCETALGVVMVRDMATATRRVRAALLGAEDLATDLCAERGADAVELDYARRRFLLECRAAGIEPVDAPFTYGDVAGAVAEARYARRLGYRCKSAVQPEHAAPLLGALRPSEAEVSRAREIVNAFEAGRAQGLDRVRFGDHWLEVPSYMNARRLLNRAGAVRADPDPV